MKKHSSIILAALAGVVFSGTGGEAAEKCNVKVDKRTGVLLVSASGVSGTLLWGTSEGAESEPLFNVATCVVGDKAKKCEVADPATLAAKTPPSGCTLYLADDAAPCSVWIAGCTPGSRTEAPEPVCGDGQAGTGEACDGLDLDGQTCQSAGFLYGTLACDACALDTSGCTDDRFVDNGDGTVTDNSTNLMWEKKTGALGGYAVCPGGATCGDVHDVNNAYAWSTGEPYNPDGPAFFSFLAELNGPSPFAGHDDWRLPTITELKSIVDLGAPGCGSGSPCIDPVFGATQSDTHWSSTTYQSTPSNAWAVNFFYGSGSTYKTGGYYVRAVRAGS